ncbi:MAG: chromosome segregation protein [Cellvibrionaceae bacterium]|jgi:chromosome segregation protein
MHLKNIKLAGFKSFVDPTTVSFPSNLCAVVGPNGCGKSNIIDAVRWVMGESSAKNLRGESMADVIFNGSSSRKPVGQASVELMFDNSEGTLTGEYASFSEISIKRKVTRDGRNNYYLNGAKCRRRDIVDIFLGTGLGPRSYSIIEQGTISRLIEARPEELRVYIEEAAGISKYKERRRETENRMRRTKENLERLNDIREELDRQLVRLGKQAQAAEKYSEYKQQERALKARLDALRYRLLEGQSTSQRQSIQQQQLLIESLLTQRVGLDTEMEKYRSLFTEYSDNVNEIQKNFYGLGTEIARIEQRIHHFQERRRQLSGDLTQAEREQQQAQEDLQSDQRKAANWEIELAEIEPQLQTLQVSETTSKNEFSVVEEAMQAWQQQWDDFNQRSQIPRRKAEVEQSRIQHLEKAQTRLLDRTKRLQGEADLDDNGNYHAEMEELRAEIEKLQESREARQHRLAPVADDIVTDRESISADENRLSELRSQLQTARGRQASLKALQQSVMSGGEQLDRWLQSQNLHQTPRLLSQIQVEPKWQGAVELVLGDALQALCVDGVDQIAELLNSLEQGSLMLLDTQAARSSSHRSRPVLADYTRGNLNTDNLLANVYVAETLAEALAMRLQLSSYESVVTAKGLWFGPNWLRVSREADSEAGVLARQKELEQLNGQTANFELHIRELTEVISQQRQALKNKEEQREQNRRELDEINQRYHRQQSKLDGIKVRVEQQVKRRQTLASDIADAKQQLETEADQLSLARRTLQEAIALMENDTEEKEGLLLRRDQLRLQLEENRQRAHGDRDRLHALAMHHQSIKTQRQSILESIQRSQTQLTRLDLRREQLQVALSDDEDPTETHQTELDTLLEKRIRVEEQLTTARIQMEQVEQQLRDAERTRVSIEQQLQQNREQLTEMRVAAQTIQVQLETLSRQFQDNGHDLQVLLEALTEDAREDRLEEDLRLIQNRIARLGAINLAAVDEFKIDSERKHCLDKQDEDLREALDTLESAILKIDRETRTRFKETFDHINTGIQELFPKVFGGGHASLELIGEDLLDTGVTIMARPPGKRNSTIHLLSGGEKALTAIALVFSIFRLNPAPFCMLDEVDAPLDDANVGRYARLVEEMSEHVQFIYITHNKISMEVAQHLMGVTMHEAGVSRLVSVDVDKAAELAAV